MFTLRPPPSRTLTHNTTSSSAPGRSSRHPCILAHLSLSSSSSSCRRKRHLWALSPHSHSVPSPSDFGRTWNGSIPPEILELDTSVTPPQNNGRLGGGSVCMSYTCPGSLQARYRTEERGTDGAYLAQCPCHWVIKRPGVCHNPEPGFWVRLWGPIPLPG